MTVIDAHSMNQQEKPKAYSQSDQYEKLFQLALMIHLHNFLTWKHFACSKLVNDSLHSH